MEMSPNSKRNDETEWSKHFRNPGNMKERNDCTPGRWLGLGFITDVGFTADVGFPTDVDCFTGAGDGLTMICSETKHGESITPLKEYIFTIW